MRIHLPFPVSVNAMYRNVSGRGRVKTKRYKEWIKAAEAGLGGDPLGFVAGPVMLQIFVRRPDKRKRDISNLIKGVEDFLVTKNIIEDDSLVEDLNIAWDQSVPDGCYVFVRAA